MRRSIVVLCIITRYTLYTYSYTIIIAISIGQTNFLAARDIDTA